MGERPVLQRDVRVAHPARGDAHPNLAGAGPDGLDVVPNLQLLVQPWQDRRSHRSRTSDRSWGRIGTRSRERGRVARPNRTCSTSAVADLSFWQVAQRDPDHLALVEPDGRELRAAELLACANRLVHGLRDLGVHTGDAVATVLPNGAAMVEAYLAATQAGWYLVPINYHLTAGEIAYILSDSEARAFICADRFGEACRGAAEEIGFPEEARFAVGELERFRPYASLKESQPDTLPDDRTAGAVMNYTPGT